MPDDFKKVAVLLSWNTISTIQFLESTCKFVACWCYKAEYANFLEEMKQRSGCTTLESIDQWGSWYFTIARYEYTKLPRLYDAIIKARVWFSTTYCGEWGFYRDDEPFAYSRENMERAIVNRFRRHDLHWHAAVSMTPTSFYDPWNWVTDEGRVFCKELCATKGVEYKPMDHEENFYRWSWYRPLESWLLPTSLARACARVVARCGGAPDIMLPDDLRELIDEEKMYT